VNLVFTNFSVGTNPGAVIDGITLGPNAFTQPNNNAEPPDGTNIVIGASGGGSISGDFIDFSPVPANSSGVGCQPSSNNQGWCINGKNESLASYITYTMTATSGTFSAIGLAAALAEHTIAGGASGATVFREICLGVGSSFVWSPTGDNSGVTGACALAGGTYEVLAIGTDLFGGHSNTYNPFTQSVFFSPQTVAAIRDTVYLTVSGNGNGGWSAVGAFGTFEPTPEPASLLTMSSGIMVLGLLAWLRKRKAQA
jgi:hypothetical protein